jgi:hypothetical protein
LPLERDAESSIATKTAAEIFSAAVLIFNEANDTLLSGVNGLLFCHERQQTNESSPQDCLANGALEQGRCARSTTRQDSTFTIDQSPQRFQILVVHVHGPEYTAAAERAAHFLLLQTSPAFAKFLQISTRNSCHVSAIHLVQRNGKPGLKTP